ncbi:hypothetical protein RB195_021426 [Necator americanus]|uniref:Uncharacterized protein n=1 Tax=Necator americanus TaxID=51031 RepID=A0ABR1EB72_NECAM
MPRHRVRWKNYAVWPALNMPHEGVFTEDGYLFHHETPVPLEDCHIQRLLEYGIQLARGERFSPEEDKRIRKNWRSFARDHGLIYEDARFYTGFVDSLESAKHQRKQNDHLVGLGMWPRLCRKLECRSAAQIQSRIRTIFDPYYVGYPSQVSLETMLRVNELALQGESKSSIACALGISMNRLQHIMHRYTRSLEKGGWSVEDVARDPNILTKNFLNKERYRRLFETVLTKSSLSHAKVAELLQSSPGELETILRDFNWTVLIPAFPPLNAKEIKRSWRTIVEELRVSFIAHLDKSDEYQAWNSALDEVMPCVRFSLRDMIYYTKSLRKCIDKNTTLVHSQFIDKIKLTKRLSTKGIVDVESFDLNTCPIYKRILSFIRTRNTFIFRQLRFPLTAREKLRILETCYRRLRLPTDQNMLLTTLPTVNMRLFVECIIDRMQCIDPSWQPPVFFQKWVRSWPYVGMFSKHSNNEEIRNTVVDPYFLRRSLFEDTRSCLYGPKPSTRDLHPQPQIPEEEVSAPVQPSSQVPDEEEGNDGPPKKRKRQRSISNSSLTSPLQALPVPAPGIPSTSVEPETEELSWSPCKRGKESTRIAPLESKCSFAGEMQESSYDIFADFVDETIVAGNLPATGISFSEEGPPSLEQTSPRLQSCGLEEESPAPSPERNVFPWEKTEDVFSDLRISIPPRSTESRVTEPDDDTGLLPKDGWTMFLS